MNTCPVCSGKLLRHWQRRRIVLFCMECRQEMPNLQIALNNKTCLEKELILLKSKYESEKQQQDIALTQ